MVCGVVAFHVLLHFTVSGALSAHVLLATALGPSPNGPQFCHIRGMPPGGVTEVDHESARLSKLEAVVVASPDVSMASEAQPQTQPTVGANVLQKFCWQSTLDAFLKPNSIGTTRMTLILHQCNRPVTRVLFPCIIGGYHTLP